MTPPVSLLARRVGVATSVVQVVYFLPVALPNLTPWTPLEISEEWETNRKYLTMEPE